MKVLILVNKKIVGKMELVKNNSLSSIREKIKAKITDEHLFLLGEDPIEKDAENDFILDEILLGGNKISLILPEKQANIGKLEKSNESSNFKTEDGAAPIKIPRTKNKDNTSCVVMQGSKFIGESQNHKLKFYKFPKIQFDIEDRLKAKVVLFVGQTGHGKSTLINSFINVLLGVKIDDPFRYKLIVDEDESDQTKSQTKEINEYHIRSKEYPPIIIIDSPGFGDTSGIIQDKIIMDKFIKIFTEKIDSINLICFVIKSDTQRLDINQKYIFSSIMNLFAEDVKENFVAMCTHFQGAGGDPPCLKTLENENSFFHTVIPNIPEPWNYSLENKIIYDDNFENDITKALFKLTENNLKNFIKDKILNSERKSIQSCGKVALTRKQLEIYCEELEKEFESLIEERKKLEDLKEEIENEEKEIQQHLELKNKYEKELQELEKIKNKKPDDYNEIIEKKKKLEEELSKILVPKNKSVEIFQTITDIDYSTSSMNCITCKKSCHKNCNHFFVLSCSKIQKGKCLICHCEKKFHEKNNFSFVEKKITIKKSRDEYFEMLEEKLRIQFEINSLQNELSQKEKEINEESYNNLMAKTIQYSNQISLSKFEMDIAEKGKKKIIAQKKTLLDSIQQNEVKSFKKLLDMKNCINELQEIALNKSSFCTMDEYIESLIKKEEEFTLKDKQKIEGLKRIREIYGVLKAIKNIDVSVLEKLDYSSIQDLLKNSKDEYSLSFILGLRPIVNENAAELNLAEVQDAPCIADVCTTPLNNRDNNKSVNESSNSVSEESNKREK